MLATRSESALTNPPHSDTANVSGPGAARWRRALVCVLVAVFGAAAVTGCAKPDWSSNAFVVHIVAPTCEDVNTLEPLLVIEKSVGSWGKSSRTEWRSFQRLEGCGEPFEGHLWSGGVLQVWVTDYEWHRNQPTRIQLGHRVSDADTWAIGDNDGMRVDHRHIFLGTIDVGVPDGAYLPPDAIDAVVTQLEDRQACENTLSSCGSEWQHADLFTFEATP